MEHFGSIYLSVPSAEDILRIEKKLRGVGFRRNVLVVLAARDGFGRTSLKRFRGNVWQGWRAGAALKM